MTLSTHQILQEWLRRWGRDHPLNDDLQRRFKKRVEGEHPELLHLHADSVRGAISEHRRLLDIAETAATKESDTKRRQSQRPRATGSRPASRSSGAWMANGTPSAEAATPPWTCPQCRARVPNHLAATHDC